MTPIPEFFGPSRIRPADITQEYVASLSASEAGELANSLSSAVKASGITTIAARQDDHSPDVRAVLNALQRLRSKAGPTARNHPGSIPGGK